MRRKTVTGRQRQSDNTHTHRIYNTHRFKHNGMEKVTHKSYAQQKENSNFKNQSTQARNNTIATQNMEFVVVHAG